nr:mitogen-activated protein kinase kinase kinase YODA-like [Ipomoea batatas]
MRSPGRSSRVQSGAVTPIHPRAGGRDCESQTCWPDDGKQQSHPLPLPPVRMSNSLPFSHSNSATASPSVARSPGKAENLTSPGSRWKKGKLLGRGTFGHVYVGFNSDSGEMCAMKEVTLFSDDAKSKESAKQLAQEIALLSRLRHPNIVQYYGSEMVGDMMYIYLEYVSGGSIYKLLQEYGAFGETAIRSYTQQILSGLAYLHAKQTVHRISKEQIFLWIQMDALSWQTLAWQSILQGSPVHYHSRVVLIGWHQRSLRIQTDATLLLIYGVLDVQS